MVLCIKIIRYMHCIRGLGIKLRQLFLAQLINHEKTWKWKCMVLGALGCMNNADFEKKNLVRDILHIVFIF